MQVNVKKLTYYQLRFLFEVFKAGAFLTKIHTYSPQAKKAIHFLEEAGFLTRLELTEQSTNDFWIRPHQSLYLLLPTKLGVKMVTTEFFNFLQNAKLHLKHCLLIPGDQIYITKTVKNGFNKTQTQHYKYVRPPHEMLPEGTYSLAAADMRSLLIVSSDNVKYRINSWHVRDVALLTLSDLKDLETEMRKRFGQIHVKKLTHMLVKEIKDNFKTARIINQVLKSNAATGRLGDIYDKCK